MPNGQYLVPLSPPPRPGRRNHEDAAGRNAVVARTAGLPARLMTCKSDERGRPIQAAYFCTRAPTCGSAAAMCLAAPPRTAR
jgi:hypothetical protein